MSKARGNVINPDAVVSEYGADSLRLYEMFMGPLEATITAGSNADGYYAISGSNVVLTQAGVDFINGGGTLPAVNLTATDSGTPALTASDSDTPSYVAQNDGPTITVTAAASFNENDATVGTVLCHGRFEHRALRRVESWRSRQFAVQITQRLMQVAHVRSP